MTTVTEIASGLRFPEGPVALPDGSVVLVEIARGTLTRVAPDGSTRVVAQLGGGPNGAALGPDGRVYVTNNGGLSFHERDGRLSPGHSPDGAPNGWIDAVDLASGKVERLYEHPSDVTPRAPNDLVFDRHGGFWFSDLGKTFRGQPQRDRGAVYYATPNGRSIRRVIFPLEGANGIGLSPDGGTLYVAETVTGRLWAYQVTGPGEVARHGRTAVWERGTLLWAAGYYSLLDSLAIDAAGNVCVADIPNGGITVISPDGTCIEQYPMPDPVTTNICFGGPDMKTAYVTLSSSGRLVSLPWPRAGLVLQNARKAGD